MATELKGSAEQLARIKGAVSGDGLPRKEINDLAREFAMMRGYSVPEGYDFEKAIHPDERSAWMMAKKSWDFWAARIPSKARRDENPPQTHTPAKEGRDAITHPERGKYPPMDGKGLGPETPERHKL